ncbi:MAG TPA: hypothetical protein VJY65_04830 [Chloroflexota bacterium]|nr:hypothetical protein [Chloroflexota bacterium]
MVIALDTLVVPLIVDTEYITLAQAARIAGYRSTTTLHKAVRENRLRTITTGPLNTRVTTREWLNEYLASIRQNKSRRGRPHATARSADLEDID